MKTINKIGIVVSILGSFINLYGLFTTNLGFVYLGLLLIIAGLGLKHFDWFKSVLKDIEDDE